MIDAPTVRDLNALGALPVTALVIGTCILLMVDLFVPSNRKYLTALMAAATILVSLALSLLAVTDTLDLGRDADPVFFGAFINDDFTHMVNVTVLVTALLGVMVAYNYLERTGIQRGEYYSLLLLTTSGVMFMGAAGDLIVVFVALELLSIPLYILSGFRQSQAGSQESALKYFLLGAFATGFLVYGIALLYGATGTTNIREIWTVVNETQNSSVRFLLLAGAGLSFVGLGFKVAAVPFHMWTPDVYQGAPTPVVAYMSVAAKVGGFAALLRVLAAGLPNFVLEGQDVAAWQDSVWLVAVLTMVLANIVAISQTDLKRLLAYSSIAHAGYILIAVASAGSQGVADQAARAVLIYLMAYAFTNAGAFSVIIALERNDATNTELDSVRGLAKRRPWLAAAMAVFMFSLTGIPLTGGFIGKWFVFQAAMEADLIWVAVVGVVTSVISAFYYLRVVWLMYFEEGESEAYTPMPLAWAIGISAVGTLVLGVLPYLLSDMARDITLAFGG